MIFFVKRQIGILFDDSYRSAYSLVYWRSKVCKLSAKGHSAQTVEDISDFHDFWLKTASPRPSKRHGIKKKKQNTLFVFGDPWPLCPLLNKTGPVKACRYPKKRFNKTKTKRRIARFSSWKPIHISISDIIIYIVCIYFHILVLKLSSNAIYFEWHPHLRVHYIFKCISIE